MAGNGNGMALGEGALSSHRHPAWSKPPDDLV